MYTTLLTLLLLSGTPYEIPLESLAIFQPSHLVAFEDQIAIFDRSDMRLTFFNHQGDLLSRHGRKGQGPGEFQQIGGLYAGGSSAKVSVVDFGNARIGIYNSHGLLDAHTVLGLPQSAQPVFVENHFVGAVYLDAEFNLIWQDATQQKRTLWQPKNPIDKGFTLKFDGRPDMHVRYLWHQNILIRVFADKVVLTDTLRREVVLFDLKDPAQHQTWQHQLQRTPVQDQDIEQARSTMPEFLRAQLGSRLNAPNLWPFALDLFMDDKKLYFVAPTSTAGYIIHSYSHTGEPLDTHALPKQPSYIQNQTAYILDANQSLLIVHPLNQTDSAD